MDGVWWLWLGLGLQAKAKAATWRYAGAYPRSKLYSQHRVRFFLIQAGAGDFGMAIRCRDSRELAHQLASRLLEYFLNEGKNLLVTYI